MSEQILNLVRRLAAGDEGAVEAAKALDDEPEEDAMFALQWLNEHGGTAQRHEDDPFNAGEDKIYWMARTTCICHGDEPVKLLHGAGYVHRATDEIYISAAGTERLRRPGRRHLRPAA